MTQTSKDADTGEDGYVRLRAYLPHSDTMYLTAGCSCGRLRDISIQRAIRLVGNDDTTTVKQLAARLRCSECGARRIQVSISVNARPHELRLREGPLDALRDEG